MTLKLPNKITCWDLTAGSSGTLALINPNSQFCDPKEQKILHRHENLDSNNEAEFSLTYSTVLRYKHL
jgi:hypothetical protein